MAWSRFTNTNRAIYKPRHHRGETYYPKFGPGTKKQIEKALSKYKIAHTNYYRIYYIKYRGHILYVGPSKISHGGIRHRPTDVANLTNLRRKISAHPEKLHNPKVQRRLANLERRIKERQQRTKTRRPPRKTFVPKKKYVPKVKKNGKSMDTIKKS